MAYSIVIAIVLGIFFIGSIVKYIEIENAGGEVIPIDLITVGIIKHPF
ncbi:hypothetical protein H9X57_05400 [Flavobacterium piscinae]|nr:hypothetical protein [Flavobacterium piscinae]